MEGRVENRLWNLPRGLAAGCLAGFTLWLLDLGAFGLREPEEFEVAAIVLRRVILVGAPIGLLVGIMTIGFVDGIRPGRHVARFVVAVVAAGLALPPYTCASGFITPSTRPTYIVWAILFVTIAWQAVLLAPGLGRRVGIPALILVSLACAADLTVVPGHAERAILASGPCPLVEFVEGLRADYLVDEVDPLDEVSADAAFAASRRERMATRTSLRSALQRRLGGKVPRHLVWIDYHVDHLKPLHEGFGTWSLEMARFLPASNAPTRHDATYWRHHALLRSRWPTSMSDDLDAFPEPFLAAGLEPHPSQPRGNPYTISAGKLLAELPLAGDARYFLQLKMWAKDLPEVATQLDAIAVDAPVLLVARPTYQFERVGGYSDNLKEPGIYWRLMDRRLSAPLPLLVHVPCVKHRRVTKAGGEIDILPTLLDLLDLPVSGSMQGQSLAGYLLDDPDPLLLPVPFAYAEVFDAVHSEETGWTEQLRARVFFEGRHRLEAVSPNRGLHLFDLEEDPELRLNLASRRPDVVQAMLAKIKVLEEESRLLRDGKSLSDDFEVLRGRLKGGPITARIRLLEEVIAKKPEGLRNLLREQLADPEQHYLVKLAIVERAGGMLGADILPALRELIRHAPAYGAKATALDRWRDLGLPLEGEDREMVAVALQAHPLIGWRAARLLARHGDERARLQLEPAMKLGDPEIAYETALSLRELGDDVEAVEPVVTETSATALVLRGDLIFSGADLVSAWRPNDSYHRGVVLPDGQVAFLAKSLDPILLGPELVDVGKTLEVELAFTIEGSWPENEFDLELFWRFADQDQFFAHQRQTAKVAADGQERQLRFRIEPDRGKAPAQLRVDFFQEPHLVTISAIRLRIAD